MNNIMTIYFCLIGFCFFCVIQNSVCDICSTCLCSVQNNKKSIIDCHGKHLGNNDMLNFDLLTLNEYQALDKLILSKNDIVNLPRNLLSKLRLLKSLDLSKNAVEKIYTTMFINLCNLEDLNLSKNALRNFDSSLIEALPALRTLNVSYNNIDSIATGMNTSIAKIITLDLSHNNVSSVPKQFVESLPILEYLDLSFNKIYSLQDCNLMQLNSLKVIYIRNNFFTTLNMQMLPQSVRQLYIGYNQITEVLHDLTNVEVLSIEHNKISKIHENITADNLQYLNISGNMLSNFPSILFGKLSILDISFNNLTYIPAAISTKNFPLLVQLNVSANPIQNLTLRSEIKLRWFVANNMKKLETIDKDTLTNLKTPPKHCIHLAISNNKMLSFIHEDAIKHLNLCSLDLSNNLLSYVAHKLIVRDSNAITCSVNLQGNPFICNCSLQWMLNDLIPKLYSTEPDLLDNLRCAWPIEVSNLRMVHWFGWESKIFCTNMSNFHENLAVNIARIQSSEVVKINSSFGVLAIIGATLTTLILLVIIGIIWTRRVYMKMRRVNRKF